MPSYLPQSSEPRMIVVGGEALVDLIAQPDGELRGVLGGGPYNTARTIGRLGGTVTFLGGISTDRFGSRLFAALIDDGVAEGLVQRSSLPTTLAMVELDEQGGASYSFYFEGTAAQMMHAVVLPKDVSAIHIGTLGLVLEPMASVLAEAVAQVADRALVVVDANCRPSATANPAAYVATLRAVLAQTHVLKVSNEDLDFLAEHDSDMATPGALLKLGPSVILLTHGGDGVDIVTADETIQVPAEPVDVVDTIGAGDSFGGGFLAWWMQSGWGVAELGDMDRLHEAVAMGCRVAAITCEREGADPPRAHEVQGWAP